MRSEPTSPAIMGMDGSALAWFAGLALVIVGSIGPWATSPLTSVSGLDGDGKWTIILAVAAVYWLVRRGAPDIRAGLICLAILGFGVYNAIHIHQVVSRVTIYGTQVDHVGWGVYAVIAGVLLTLGAMIRKQRG